MLVSLITSDVNWSALYNYHIFLYTFYGGEVKQQSIVWVQVFLRRYLKVKRSYETVCELKCHKAKK